MLDAGMNVARLNFSHGDHPYHRGTVQNLRTALKQRPKLSCAVMLDTKGPEIRTGLLESGKTIDLLKDQILEITTDYTFKGTSEKIACSYTDLPTSVKVGSTILIADGSITATVTEILQEGVKVQVGNSATLGEKKYEPPRNHRKPSNIDRKRRGRPDQFWFKRRSGHDCSFFCP